MQGQSIYSRSPSRLLKTLLPNLLSLSLILVLLTTFFQTPIVHVVYAPATVRQVPSLDYPTIQSAIDASRRGDIVQVSPGTYHERLIVPVTLLAIRGENKQTTIIDANTNGTAIALEANSITVTGFTLQNGGFNYGIKSYTYGGHNISNNIIENFVDGIYFLQSDSNFISRNTFFNNSMHAISLGTSLDNQIIDNNISDSAFGIYLSYADSTTVLRNNISNTSYGIYSNRSTQNTINGNTAQSSSVGIQTGLSDYLTINNNIISGGMYAIQLQRTNYTQITNNSLTQASYGLYLAYSNYNTISGSPSPGNLIAKNDWGLVIYNSTGNNIKDGNIIAENTWGIYVASYSSGNTIYHNNFVGNVRQAFQDIGCVNTWDNGVEGNYWSDYIGYPPAGGVDYRPLPAPWPLRNLATTNVTVSTTDAYPGDIVTINATVRNLGAITETFKVKTYYNATLIATQTTTLTAGSTTKLTYNWNTTNVQGNYIISATAEPIPYIEGNYTDNTLQDGTVRISAMIGDINRDGTVNNTDLNLLNQAYGSKPGDPNWNPNADLNKDNIINVLDLHLLSKNYGKTS